MTTQKYANRIARAAGYQRATKIVYGRVDRVVSHRDHGYFKDSTGSRVPNAYRNKFGWKNTHYEPAVTVVEVAVGPSHWAYVL